MSRDFLMQLYLERVCLLAAQLMKCWLSAQNSVSKHHLCVSAWIKFIYIFYNLLRDKKMGEENVSHTSTSQSLFKIVSLWNWLTMINFLLYKKSNEKLPLLFLFFIFFFLHLCSVALKKFLISPSTLHPTRSKTWAYQTFSLPISDD